ncbi:MAG: BMP family ABC transporter substrate-binding protein [Clostridiales bacterium]|jgi:basic membrane protein A|nr:BMP family ABC transporter substrate-binding protein [Clostridiales bacterium]
MKNIKKTSFLLALILFAASAFSGCAKAPEPQAGTQPSYKAVLLVPGTLGDKSFFDAANAGMQKAKSELGIETKVIEMGTDKTKYEPTFRDVCAQDWDLIISGSADMTDMFNEFSLEYPDQSFLNYDATTDAVNSNIYSVGYAANELSYLAGAVAALATTSSVSGMNPEARIGFIGGMDIPGINDFLVGYIKGAQDVNPEVKVVISYAQDFTNPGKGKELALNQYSFGADVIFSAAGGTGMGVLDAALEKGLYAIGVDSDQALLFKSSDEKKASQIITSAIKQIDMVIFNGIKAGMDGTLPVGSYKLVSFKDQGVGIARNEYYDKIMPAELKAKVDEIEKNLIDGKVAVPSIVGMPQEELDAMRDAVK